MNPSGIYIIKNIVTGHIYVGSAVSLPNRKYSHERDLMANRHVNKHLQNSWNKYGESNFQFTILIACPVEYLIKAEQFFIDHFIAKLGREMLFNVRLQAGDTLRDSWTEEQRRRLSSSRKGQSVIDRGLSFKGRTHSEETKVRMRAAAKGKTKSPEHCANISKGQQGKTVPQERKDRTSATLKGRVFTEEHKAKVSQGLRNMWAKRKAAQEAPNAN